MVSDKEFEHEDCEITIRTTNKRGFIYQIQGMSEHHPRMACCLGRLKYPVRMLPPFLLSPSVSLPPSVLFHLHDPDMSHASSEPLASSCPLLSAFPPPSPSSPCPHCNCAPSKSLEGT
eukprot:754531-Hanusia_phi.AAC.3